ncbi:MAG: hypothetical protein ACT4NX_08920 [Deltaproteobacteria bacterium]
MRKVFLALVMAVALSSVAMASDLGSADSSFLFGQDQVAASTMTDIEMQATQGQLISLNAVVGQVLNILGALGLTPILAPVLGLLPPVNLDAVVASVLGIVNQVVAVNGSLAVNVLGIAGLGIAL